jgi:hypothetical protein
MRDTLAEVVELLEGFVNGRTDPAAFVASYGLLWRRIRQEQDDALAPSAPTLQQSRSELVASHISAEEYARRVEQVYAALPPLPVAPGSSIDVLLSHLFVEADAYEGDPTARESYQIDDATLREEASKVLAGLRE